MWGNFRKSSVQFKDFRKREFWNGILDLELCYFFVRTLESTTFGTKVKNVPLFLLNVKSFVFIKYFIFFLLFYRKKKIIVFGFVLCNICPRFVVFSELSLSYTLFRGLWENTNRGLSYLCRVSAREFLRHLFYNNIFSVTCLITRCHVAH